LEALAYGDLSLAMSLSLPMLTAKIITEHGSEEQKKQLLKQYSDGSMFHVGLGINNSSIMGNASTQAFRLMRVGKSLFLTAPKQALLLQRRLLPF